MRWFSALWLLFCVLSATTGFAQDSSSGSSEIEFPAAEGASKPDSTFESPPPVTSSQPSVPSEPLPAVEGANSPFPADAPATAQPTTSSPNAAPSTATPPASTPAASGSSESVTPPSDLPTLTELEAMLSEVPGSSLDEEQQTKATEALKESIDALKRLQVLQADQVRYENDAATAAERAKQYQAELDQMPPSAEIELPSDLPAMKALQMERSKELEALKAELDSVQAQRAKITTQKAELEKLKAEADKRKADFETAINAPANVNEPEALSKARRLRAKVSLARLEQQQKTAQAELAKFAAEESAHLYDIRTALLKKRIERRTAALKKLEEKIALLEQEEAARRIQEARQAALFADERFSGIAKGNQYLAERIQQMTLQVAALEDALKERKAQAEKVQTSFTSARERVEQVGELTQTIGLMLRRGRAELPDVTEVRQSMTSRQEPMAAARLEELDYREAADEE